jgi:RNA polymerase sigma factor (TIGR02999 family)
MQSPAAEVTILLEGVGRGDSQAAARLMELVYEQLRGLAAAYAAQQRPDHTLQPTALVHEAFVKLVQSPSARFNDRTHFFAVAATAMRQILTDYARAERAAKRGGAGAGGAGTAGAWERITLDQADFPSDDNQLDLLALDDALGELARFDQRKHRVIELRFFGGLSVEEVATVLNLSKTTVESEWRSARAWLLARMER